MTEPELILPEPLAREAHACPLGRLCIDGCPGAREGIILMPPILPGIQHTVDDVKILRWCREESPPALPLGAVLLCDHVPTTAAGAAA